MWAFISTDGRVEEHEGIPTLEQMQARVEGYVERVSLHRDDARDAYIMLNEEGKLLGLAINHVADRLANRFARHCCYGQLPVGDTPNRCSRRGHRLVNVIVGPVALVGDVDDFDEWVKGLDPLWLETAREYAAERGEVLA